MDFEERLGLINYTIVYSSLVCRDGDPSVHMGFVNEGALKFRVLGNCYKDIRPS